MTLLTEKKETEFNMEYFITESQYHLLSTRRRSDAIERVVDNVMESMYTCDYKNSNHFIKGVSDELSFYYQDVDDLKDLPYSEISEFLFNGLFHHITGYWEEKCGGQEISETIVTNNTYKKNLTNDFKIFAKVLNTTNKLTGKPYYDFSDIYLGLKVMYIEPMTENGAEIYVNVEKVLPSEIRNKWWHHKLYKDKIFSRLYELKTLMGLGYDFTLKVYP